MSTVSANLNPVEFGVCLGTLSNTPGTLIPVDRSVQENLVQMIEDTRQATAPGADGAEIEQYDPAEDYSPERKATLPLSDTLATVLANFYRVGNRAIDPNALRRHDEITAYFCATYGPHGDKTIGIRRAATFKSVLKARLVRVLDDTLHSVAESTFRLDTDFDLLITSNKVLINHIASFAHLAEVDERVTEAAVANAKIIAQKVPFINFGSVVQYASTHKRIARLLASLRSRVDLTQISRDLFLAQCQLNNVKVDTVEGGLVPGAGFELAFVQLLDRRLYTVTLIPGEPENYEAASRKPVGAKQHKKAASA